AGIPARYPADPAAADPPDARPVESHPEPSPSGLAHKRPPGSRVEVCPSADELAQAVTEPLFTPDSGSIDQTVARRELLDVAPVRADPRGHRLAWHPRRDGGLEARARMKIAVDNAMRPGTAGSISETRSTQRGTTRCS